jgi:hypothetical protein
MLVISACASNETSLSNNHESLFTKYLIKLLEREENKLEKLKNTISNNIFDASGIRQTVTISSSHIIHPILWNWLYGLIDVDVNSDKTYIVIDD